MGILAAQPGRDDAAVSCNHRPGIGRIDAADRGDALAGNGHVGGEAGQTRPVDDRRTADDEVERSLPHDATETRRA